MSKTLSSIPNGTEVLVRKIHASALSVKLLEMGLFEGKQLKVLYRAPFGDPMAIDIGGYVLSLRNDEAALIEVELISSAT
ncbi:MAG: ferrous iron transport protein A [Flavobacteriaceae bacterium]